MPIDDGIFYTRRLSNPDDGPGAGRFGVFRRAPEDILQVISLFNVTHLIAAPFQIRTLLEAQAKSGLQCPNLRQVFLGGVLPNSLLAEVRQQLCPNVICAYGSTELGMVAYGPAASMRGTEGATGFVMPDVLVEVVDKEGAVLGLERGTVRIRWGARPIFHSHAGRRKNLQGRLFFIPATWDGSYRMASWSSPAELNEIINRGGDKAAPGVHRRGDPQASGDRRARPYLPVPGRIKSGRLVCKGKLNENAVLEACRRKACRHGAKSPHRGRSHPAQRYGQDHP